MKVKEGKRSYAPPQGHHDRRGTRLQAAINLQVPDRVPVVPIVYYFAATYAGITNYELYDPKKYNQAIDKVFYELGPWDALCYMNPYYREIMSIYLPMRVKDPGYRAPPRQHPPVRGGGDHARGGLRLDHPHKQEE